MSTSSRPLNLQLVIDILTYVSTQTEPVRERVFNSKREGKDKLKIEDYFIVLNSFDIVELIGIPIEGRHEMAIKSLKETGQQLANLFKNKEVVDALLSQFGQEISGNDLTTVLSMGSKILGDLLNRDPEKKAERQERRGKKRLEQNEILTFRNAKNRLLKHARAQIPAELADLVKIPTRLGNKNLYIQNSDHETVLRIVKWEFGEEVSVRVDINNDIPGLLPITFFELSAPGDTDMVDLIKEKNVEKYLADQEKYITNNIEVLLTDEKSEIARLISLYRSKKYAKREEERKPIEPEISSNDPIKHESGTPDSTFDSTFDLTSGSGDEMVSQTGGQEEPQTISPEELKQQTAQQEFAEPLQEVEPELPPAPPETINNTLQLAHLNSDSAHKGKDLLGFEQDVEAFAAIMALEKLTPPLAIALFGQWGTGKSFFMQKLSEKVEELAKYQGFLKNKEEDDSDTESGFPEEKPFCEGICQIQFNAWSYMDTNLWASLVTRIFEGLDDYINDNRSEAEQEMDTIKSGIAEQLDVAKGQIAELEARKAQVQHSIDTLKDQVGTAQGELESKIKEIKSTSRQKAINDAITAAEVKNNLSAVLDKAGITKENLDQVNPELILKELKSAQTFVHQFLHFSRSDWLLVVLGALLFVVPGLIPTDLENGIFLGLEKAGAVLTLLVGGLAKVRNTANKLSPLVNGVLKIKNDYDAAVSEAISQHEQDILARRIEADQKEVELNQLNLQLKAKEAEIKEMAYKPDSVLAQKAMYNFITRKAASNDYSRHLGIISMIRKDFQTLSELFVESKKATKVPEKSKKKYEEFKKIREGFDKPLQRIVLYVDDLDRCPEERVVEVLEAVNLIMAFPLFVVVVGVDPRWVKNALIKKYYLQFTGHIKGSDKEADSQGMEEINPSDYLEKIFQIPFHLKAPEDESIKNMITHLLGDAVQEKPEEPEAEEVDADGLPDIDLDAFFADKSAEVAEAAEKELDRAVNLDDFEVDTPAMAPAAEEMEEDAEGMDEEDESEEAVEEDSEEEVPEGLKVVTPASLRLHWEEGEYMRNLSWLIGNTPRTVKRFVNMYRIIRAHEGLSYEDASDKKDLLRIMFLLALQTGAYHRFAQQVHRALRHEKMNGFRASLIYELNQFQKMHDDHENDPYAKFLLKTLNSKTLKRMDNDSCDKIYSYSKFIGRFSFKRIKHFESSTSEI